MKKAPGDFKRSSGAVYLCVVYWNISSGILEYIYMKI